MILKLTETVFVQESPAETRLDAADWTTLDGPLLANSTTLLHVVNFYDATPPIRRVQELTADTMRRAAASVSDVRLIAVVSQGEAGAVPFSFEAAAELQRTVAEVRRFNLPRPLPLLFDILANGAAAAKPDSYLVFTNSDICVLPHFYSTVRCLIERGVDCLIVNRRSVAPVESYGSAPEFAALEVGTHILAWIVSSFPQHGFAISLSPTRASVRVGSCGRYSTTLLSKRVECSSFATHI